MCHYLPPAEIADAQAATTQDEDWLELWMALLALELAEPEAAGIG